MGGRINILGGGGGGYVRDMVLGPVCTKPLVFSPITSTGALFFHSSLTFQKPTFLSPSFEYSFFYIGN